MIVRVACSLLALVLVAGAMPGDAQADHRKRIRRAPVYEDYGGPQFVRAPLRFIFGGYELTPEETSRLYIDTMETFAKGQDDQGLFVILNAIKSGNSKNKYALAGLLIRTNQ